MTPHRATFSEETLLPRKVAFYELPGPVARRFFFYRSKNETPGAPLVVSVHGIARNAAAHVYRLIDEAERYGLNVIAPLFEKEQYGQYQQLFDARTRTRANIALIDILNAAARLSKAHADQVLMLGFSGGAQFTHRFVLAHPSRVISAAHVSAGWYTFPYKARRYPYGVGCSAGPIDLNLDAALSVPQHVFVGELDCERDGSFRQSPRLDQLQGATRVARAKAWVAAMTEAAQASDRGVAPTLQTLPGVGHSFSDAVEIASLPRRVFDHFAKDAGLTAVE